jgi:cell wall assembly regulator SMI1
LAKLLKKHNGEKKFLGILGHMFLSAEEIIQHWNSNKQMADQIDKDGDEGQRLYHQKELLKEKSFFDTKRLPFAWDGSGQFLSIDYTPGPMGKIGQILYIPKGEPEPMSVIASDFSECITFITHSIQSERLALMDDRAEYEEDEQHFAEVNFYKTWNQDWTEIADAYTAKNI